MSAASMPSGPAVLLVDVGNTNIKLCLADGQGILAQQGLPTPRKEWSLDPAVDPEADPSRNLVTDLVEPVALAVAALEVPADAPCLVSSVVPRVEGSLAQALEKALGVRPRFVPRDLPVPLENRYSRPEEVGADRLLGAYGARCLHPEAERIVVVDFGTATTFDCIAGDAYLGGLICPGVLSSVRALTVETAKLPEATLEIDPTGLHLGRSTLDSLNQGLVWGFAAMLDGLIPRLEQALGGEALVLGTGGLAPALARVSARLEHIHGDLVLEGLRQVWLRDAPAK